MFPSTRGRLIAFFATLLLAATLAAFLFVPSKLILILGAVLGGLSVGVVVYYLPGAVRDLRQRRFDRVSQLTLGILLGWASVAMTRGQATAIRLTGDLSLSNSPVVVVYLIVAILAGVLHITAPGYDEDVGVPARNWNNLIIALMAGGGAAAVLLAIDTR